MKRYARPLNEQSQKGSVAVEAAICIALILLPLAFLVFSFGKIFWHYTVVQKAVHDASLYMAKAPMEELRSGAAETVADFIIAQELADLDSGTKVSPLMKCGYRTNQNTAFITTYQDCTTANVTPFGVQAFAVMTIANPFYFGNPESGAITLLHTSTMRHAGK